MQMQVKKLFSTDFACVKETVEATVDDTSDSEEEHNLQSKWQP